MSHDDVLFGYRLRLFTLADELGDAARPAGRWVSTARPTTVWKRKVDRWGLEALSGPRAPPAADAQPDRPAPRTADHRLRARPPGLRARGGSAAELASEKWGGIRISEHGVWRVLLSVRPQHPLQAPGVDRPPPRPLRAQARAPAAGAPHRRLRARREGPDRLLLSSGGSRAPRAPSGNTPRSTSPPPSPGPSCTPPSATPAPASTARALPPRRRRARGRRLEAAARSPPTTARSSAPSTSATPSRTLGARQRFIRAGRPNTNGCVERVQLTILEECWRPAFARSLVPKSTALAADLDEYLTRLQLRPRPHRAPHPRTRARRHRLRRPQDEHRQMTTYRRYNSGLGRARWDSSPHRPGPDSLDARR